MAVKVGELYGELKLDKRPFDKGLDQAESASKGWASRIAGTLGRSAGALAKWGAVGGAVAAGGAFMLANQASDLNETISKTKVVFGDNADEVLAWGKDAATAMGMSQNAALGARATLGNLFVSMGVGSKATANMSGDMVELAGDLASFNNMDPTEVLEKLRAGLVGEAEPLRQLGVNISAVATEAKAMELGFKKVNGELTPAQKAQANYALILEQTTTAQGDFARTSTGMANQQRITAATFQDTLAGIGQAFVPLFESLLPQVTGALQTFGAWVTENMPTIQAVTENVVNAIGAVFTFLFTEVIPALVAAFEAAWPVIQEALRIVGVAIAWVSEHIIPTLQQVFAGLVDWVVANWPTISSIFETVFGIVGAVIKTVWPIVESVAKVLFPLVGKAASILFSAIDYAFKAMKPVIELLAKVVSAVWGVVRPIWEAIGKVAGTIFGHVGDVVSSFGKTFGRIFEGIADIASEVWDTVTSAIKGGINLVIGLVNGLLSFLNNIRVPIPRVEIPGTDIGIGGGFFDPFNIGLVPRLAKGGIVSGAGLALLGEEGPELAVLPRGAQVIPAPQTAAMLGEGHMVVELRDPDNALARGGYSQADVERAITAGVRGLLGAARHAGARV